jgi:hypothetical protein
MDRIIVILIALLGALSAAAAGAPLDRASLAELLGGTPEGHVPAPGTQVPVPEAPDPAAGPPGSAPEPPGSATDVIPPLADDARPWFAGPAPDGSDTPLRPDRPEDSDDVADDASCADGACAIGRPDLRPVGEDSTDGSGSPSWAGSGERP